MQLNYMGAVNVLKAVLPLMVQRKQGHVVVVGSIMSVIGAFWDAPCGRRSEPYGATADMMYVCLPANPRSPAILVVRIQPAGFTGYASYAPSKWAVRGLCDCLRSEVRSRPDLMYELFGSMAGALQQSHSPSLQTMHDVRHSCCSNISLTRTARRHGRRHQHSLPS